MGRGREQNDKWDKVGLTKEEPTKKDGIHKKVGFRVAKCPSLETWTEAA